MRQNDLGPHGQGGRVYFDRTMECAHDQLSSGKAAGARSHQDCARLVCQCKPGSAFTRQYWRAPAPVSFAIEAALHHEPVDAPRGLSLMDRVPVEVVAARYEQCSLRVGGSPQFSRGYYSIS
jgi:hypothetical protein